MDVGSDRTENFGEAMVPAFALVVRGLLSWERIARQMHKYCSRVCNFRVFLPKYDDSR